MDVQVKLREMRQGKIVGDFTEKEGGREMGRGETESGEEESRVWFWSFNLVREMWSYKNFRLTHTSHHTTHAPGIFLSKTTPK